MHPRPRIGLLDRELVVVTGKGGVGKSTVAAALAHAAARRGARAIVAEVAGRDDVARGAGRDGSDGVELQLDDGVHHLSIDPDRALEEYVVDQLGSRTLAATLTHNGAFRALAGAAPGLRELLTMGKAWELAAPNRRDPEATAYDLVILDAPSTGHGLALLQAPQTFAKLAREGRIARQAQTIDALVRDPARIGVVLVTQGEELPVSEALALALALGDELGLGIDLAVANALTPDRIADRDMLALQALPADPAIAAALRAQRRARSERAQVARLRDGLGAGATIAQLPFLYDDPLGRGPLRRLATELDRWI